MNHFMGTPWWVTLGLTSRSEAFGSEVDEDPYQDFVIPALALIREGRNGEGERFLRALIRELDRG